MIIILKKNVKEEEIEHIIEKAKSLGLKANVSRGIEKTVVGLIGPEDVLRVTPLEVFPGVEQVIPVLAPYKLVSREFKNKNSLIKIGNNLSVGGKQVVIMAGPCSIESLK